MRICPPRKNAVDEVYATLGKDQTYTDTKGEWRINHVGRQQLNSFYTYLSFQPHPDGKLKGNPYGESGHIYFHREVTIQSFKARIKSRTGYTPMKEVLVKLYTYAMQLCEAYFEEDQYFASQDKDDALLEMNRLFDVAIERYRSGDILNPHSRCPFERYLTKGEIETIIDTQKTINGHAFQEVDHGYLTGHLKQFKKRLADTIAYEERKREQRELEQQRHGHLHLLEVDVEFRKLVAHAIAAAQVKQSSSVDHELAQRLFGYTQSLDQYREIFSQYTQLLQQYGIPSYAGKRLVEVGRSYLAKGGMLPVVAPRYERQVGKFYYADRVQMGDRVRYVNRVGRKYLYLDGGSRVTLQTAKHA